MDIILYFRPLQKSYGKPEKLAGVQEIAEKAHVHVQVIDESPTPENIPPLCAFWGARGAIVECGGREAEIHPRIFGKMPIVFFNHSFHSLPAGCFAIRHDSRATGELAARELLMSGVPNFAYVRSPGNPFWCREREQGFRDALKLNGKSCVSFSWTNRTDNATDRVKALKTFLLGLPRPSAVFAANDFLAAETITAAKMASLDIPNDIAVLGVDNTASVCEHAAPTLSSIEPDFRRGGNLAMLMLLAVLRDGNDFRGPRQRTFGDLHVVRRLSTRRFQRTDVLVSEVLDLIRRKACLGLTAAEAASRFPCSRRMADRRFHQVTGHTILDEIQAVRLERAKELLLNPNQQLKAVSDFCGLKNPNSLRKFFKRETGLTLSEWRAQELPTLPAQV